MLYFAKGLDQLLLRGRAECEGWDAKGGRGRGRAVVFMLSQDNGTDAPGARRAEYATPVSITEDEDGGYVAAAPALPGCVSQGETRARARENLEEAISLYLEYFLENGGALPPGLDPAPDVAAISVRGRRVSAKIGAMP